MVAAEAGVAALGDAVHQPFALEACGFLHGGLEAAELGVGGRFEGGAAEGGDDGGLERAEDHGSGRRSCGWQGTHSTILLTRVQGIPGGECRGATPLCPPEARLVERCLKE